MREFCLALAAFSWLLLTASMAAEPPGSLDRGFELLKAEKPARALPYFRNAAREDPHNVRANEGLARAYHQLGEYLIAAGYADQRLRLAPDDKAWRKEWARIVFAVESRQEEVLATARQWLAEDPSDRAARILLGRVLADKGDYPEGRQVLESTLTGAPADVEALTILAEIEDWDEHFEEAQKLLARAHALQPQNSALRDALQRATQKAARYAAVRFEPTLPLVITLIGLSTLVGQVADRLGPRTYLRMMAGAVALSGGALGWLYVFPMG